MSRRLAVSLLACLVLGLVAGPGVVVGEEPVFRGLQGNLDDVLVTYALSVSSQAVHEGEVVHLPSLTAEFQVSQYAPDGQGRRLAEVVYTKLQVEPDPGGLAEALKGIMNRRFRLMIDRDGKPVDWDSPSPLHQLGLDLRQVLRNPLPQGWERRELRVGEKVAVPLRSTVTVSGVEVTTEGETVIQYAGREERDGRAQDVLLVTVESRAAPSPGTPEGDPTGQPSYYETRASGRFYVDPVSRVMTGIVMETVVTPPRDAPNLPTVATTTTVKLLSSVPLVK